MKTEKIILIKDFHYKISPW